MGMSAALLIELVAMPRRHISAISGRQAQAAILLRLRTVALAAVFPSGVTLRTWGRRVAWMIYQARASADFTSHRRVNRFVVANTQPQIRSAIRRPSNPACATSAIQVPVARGQPLSGRYRLGRNIRRPIRARCSRRGFLCASMRAI
jgi:hypothetical protein